MWVHPRNIHYIFTVKGFTMPIAAFAIFGWCMANGAGLSTIDDQSKSSTAAYSPVRMFDCCQKTCRAVWCTYL